MEISNNYPSQSFGMALKIKKGGRKFIEKQTDEFINNIPNAKKALKKTKKMDLIIDEDGFKIVPKKGNYNYEGNFDVISKEDGSIIVKAKFNDKVTQNWEEKPTVNLKFKNDEELLYNVSYKDNLTKHVEITQSLDRQEIEKSVRNKKINKLFSFWS